MAEEKLSKTEAIARSVERVADSKGLAEVGKGLGAGLVALAIALAVAAIYFALLVGPKWDGHLRSQAKCFELQELSGKIYKVNTCTGEVTELRQESKSQKNDQSK